MNIPNHWSSHTLIFDYNNKPRQVFRFGWSDISQSDAKNHAIQRCEQARLRIVAGEKYVSRFDGKGKYLDNSGLPIREQIVQRYDDLHAVTTINSYGATCLNVENVLILDLDNADIEYRYRDQLRLPGLHEPSQTWVLIFSVCGIISMLAMLYVTLFTHNAWLIMGLFASMLLFSFLANRASQLNDKKRQEWVEKQGGHLGMLDKTLQPFLTANPEANFNLYQTPQGFRLIALHDNFTANDRFTQTCFDSLPVDSTYQRLCKVQQCFRARTTGKPWRMGIIERFAGYQDFWRDDIPDKFQPANQTWLDNYRHIASRYSACHFVKQLGNAPTPAQIANFVNLHDTLCKAKQNLPLA